MVNLPFVAAGTAKTDNTVAVSGMHNGQHREVVEDVSERLGTLFVVTYHVEVKPQGTFQYVFGVFEVQAVLEQVFSVLLFVPGLVFVHGVYCSRKSCVLTNLSVLSDTNRALAESSAGFDRPNGYTGAQAPRNLLSGVFSRLETSSLMTCIGKSSDLPVKPCVVRRSVNPMRVVTNSIDSEWCRLVLNQNQDNTMLKVPYPVDEVMTPVDRALSLVLLLQTALEWADEHPEHPHIISNVLWTIESELRAAVAANDEWSQASNPQSLQEETS